MRDALLGRPVNDRDHVVVGATPEQMVAAGFRPVGRDFPVFLHPQTHEEYALARTERKTAPGYKGFLFHAAPDVTLEGRIARFREQTRSERMAIAEAVQRPTMSFVAIKTPEQIALMRKAGLVVGRTRPGVA